MKFHIVNIVDGEDPDFGKVITVVANEVKEKNSILTSNPFYNDDSKFFVFPNKDSFREKNKRDRRIWRFLESIRIFFR